MLNNNYRFHIGLSQRLWDSFKMLETEYNLASYSNYYRALSLWVMDNKDRIGDSIMKEFRLSILVELDTEKYIVGNEDSSGIILSMEHERMFGREKPKYLETLVRKVGDTLWDLATVYSGIDCPDCIYDDGLRYVMIESEDTKDKNLALYCESCERLQTLDGNVLSKEGIKIMPANKEDIAKYRI